MNILGLGRSVHVSWLIAYCSVGIVVGVIAASVVHAGFMYSLVWLIVGCSCLLFGLVVGKRWVIPIVITAGLLIGGWRGSTSSYELSVYKNLIGKTLTVTGTISEDTDVGKDGLPTVRLKDISVEERRLPGKLWVSLGKSAPIERSDKVTVRGKLGDGFANFPASIYRASVTTIKRPVPGDVALHLRDHFAMHVRAVIHGPAASLGLGYLLGQRRALPEKLNESLRIAGLMHVVVASGYNLTILVRLARRVFMKISKFVSMALASSMIIGFIAVTGLSPSMSRAGLVAFLSLAAWYYGRRFHPLVLLTMAAAITLLINPSYGSNDLGWSLSFASFAGVMIVAPLLQSYFFGDKKPGTVRQIVGETISAQLVTLPLLASAFGVISVVALGANLLILPLVPLAMLLVFLSGLIHIVWPWLAIWMGIPTQYLLDYMIWVAEHAAALPWAQVSLRLTPMLIIVFYGVLVVCCWWMRRATGLELRDHNVVV